MWEFLPETEQHGPMPPPSRGPCYSVTPVFPRGSFGIRYLQRSSTPWIYAPFPVAHLIGLAEPNDRLFTRHHGAAAGRTHLPLNRHRQLDGVVALDRHTDPNSSTALSYVQRCRGLEQTMNTLAREACLIQTCVPINETQRLVSATERRPAIPTLRPSRSSARRSKGAGGHSGRRHSPDRAGQAQLRAAGSS